MRSILVTVLLLGVPLVQAANVTIDFSDPSLPVTGNEEGFSTDGYDFTFGPVPIPQPNAFYITTSTPGNPGDDEALAYCPLCYVAMERSDGAGFSLYSFDAVSVFSNIDLQVTGYLEAGGTLVETVAVSAVGPAQSFAINWGGLVRVEFDSVSDDGAQILDNIIATAVPIPAAAWLFGSALAGLSLIRRKKRLL